MHKKSITEKYLNIDNLQIFKVGGCVRDKLLNLPISDTDYVVIGSSPTEMMNLGFKPVGKDFPVFLHPVTHEEYALARSEKKISSGHRGFSFSTAPEITLIEDLERRDITINAIAEDKHGKLIDPFGGCDDLNHKIIRHISAAFIEDPLRILRVARFSAKLDFQVANETLNLMHKITLSGELETISRERIWTEINKALMTEMSTKFLEVLYKVEALPIVLPEFVQLVMNNSVFQILTHVAKQMHQSAYSLEQRFAIFYYFVSTTFTLPETEQFIHHSMASLKSKTLAYLLIRYYASLQNFATLSPEVVYNTIVYLDPIRRKERYQTLVELMHMLAIITHDTKTPLHLEILKQIVNHFDQIDYMKLKNEHPTDFVDQLHKLKLTIIKHYLTELSSINY